MLNARYEAQQTTEERGERRASSGVERSSRTIAGVFVVLRQQEGLHLFLESQFNGQNQGLRGSLLRPFSHWGATHASSAWQQQAGQRLAHSARRSVEDGPQRPSGARWRYAGCPDNRVYQAGGEAARISEAGWHKPTSQRSQPQIDCTYSTTHFTAHHRCITR